MLKQLLILFIATICTFSAFSQVELDAKIPVEKKKDKLKFVFNFDTRNSFVIGHKVKFSGIKIGLGNKKHRFGIGLHNTRKPIVKVVDRVENPDATDTTLFDYSYSSFYYERILYKAKRWELSAPLHFNFGSLKASYIDTANKKIPFLEHNANSLTLSLKGHFKIFRWVGVGCGLGYNVMLNNDRKIRRALNAPFYSYGVKVFLGELWKMTFKKEYRKSEWVD